MRTTIKKHTYEEMKFLADVRGQTMAELIDDIWIRFDKSLLVKAPPITKLIIKPPKSYYTEADRPEAA